jgi:hypothetical protein
MSVALILVLREIRVVRNEVGGSCSQLQSEQLQNQ